jgi:hypothetical protein
LDARFAVLAFDVRARIFHAQPGLAAISWVASELAGTARGDALAPHTDLVAFAQALTIIDCAIAVVVDVVALL